MGNTSKAGPVLALRLALFTALFASAVLVVDYKNVGDPGFCGVGSGCLAVRMSGYSAIGPFQLPTLGLTCFAALLVLSLGARTKAHTAIVFAGTAAAAFGALGLVVLQAAVIHAFCKWCMIVDTSAVVAAGAAWVVHKQVSNEAEAGKVAAALGSSLRLSLAWALGAVVAVALPFVWGEYPVVPPLPEGIAKLAVPGKVTIVSFTDFECPFCRALHPTIHEMVEKDGGKLAVVRKMVPLPSHEGAMPAALAYVCVPEEALADALYDAPEEQLTRDGVIAIAKKLGNDPVSLASCMDSPGAKARVEDDTKLLESMAAKALPTTFVGPRIVLGADPLKIQKSVLLALEPNRLALPVAGMLGLAGLIAAALAALTLASLRASRAPDPQPAVG